MPVYLNDKERIYTEVCACRNQLQYDAMHQTLTVTPGVSERKYVLCDYFDRYFLPLEV